MLFKFASLGSRGEVVVNYLIFAGMLYSKQIKLPTLKRILEMSCKICQDHARLTWTNVQKSYKSILARS